MQFPSSSLDAKDNKIYQVNEYEYLLYDQLIGNSTVTPESINYRAFTYRYYKSIYKNIINLNETFIQVPR